MAISFKDRLTAKLAELRVALLGGGKNRSMLFMGVAGLVLAAFVAMLVAGSGEGPIFTLSPGGWKTSSGGLFSRYVADDPNQKRTLIDTSLLGADGRGGGGPLSDSFQGPKERKKRALPDISEFSSEMPAGAADGPGGGTKGELTPVKSIAGAGGSPSAGGGAEVKSGVPQPAAPADAQGAPPAGKQAAKGKGLVARMTAVVRSAASRLTGGSHESSSLKSFTSSSGSNPNFGPGGKGSGFEASPGGIGGNSGSSAGGFKSDGTDKIAMGGAGGAGSSGTGSSGGGSSGGEGSQPPDSSGSGGDYGGGGGGGGGGIEGAAVGGEEKVEVGVCKKQGDTLCTVYNCALAKTKEAAKKSDETAKSAKEMMTALDAIVKTDVDNALAQEDKIKTSAMALKYPCKGCEGLSVCIKWTKTEAQFIVDALIEERGFLEKSLGCLSKEGPRSDPKDPRGEPIPPPSEDCRDLALKAIDKERSVIEQFESKQSHTKSQLGRCLETVPIEHVVNGKKERYEAGVRVRADFSRFAEWYLQAQNAIYESLKEDWCLRNTKECDTRPTLDLIDAMNKKDDMKALLDELGPKGPPEIAAKGKEAIDLLKSGAQKYAEPQGDESRNIVNGSKDIKGSADAISDMIPLWDEPIKSACGLNPAPGGSPGSGGSAGSGSGSGGHGDHPGGKGNEEL